MHDFAFEKLHVYQRALAFVESADAAIDAAGGRVARSRIDQLARASLSIPLNIAEGNGRWHARDRRQFFAVARGSVFECVPIIQVMQKKGVLPDEKYRDLYEQLLIIAKMLSKMMQYEDAKASSELPK